MTLTEMRYIVALAREKHFGRAAEACHISQPTLSVALKKVEGQLGAALFERAANEVRITPLGERIVVQAQRVLEEAIHLEEIASTVGDPLNGPLRVGVIYTVAPYLLPQLIPAVHRQAPNMPLFLKEDFTNNLLPTLKAGDIDVAVVALPCQETGVVAQAVYEEDFRVIVPCNHPWANETAIDKDSLDTRDILLLGHGNCFRDQVLESCPHISAMNGLSNSIEGSSLETIRYMVASGAGVAVMPATAADPLANHEPLVKVLPFTNPSPNRTIGLLWRITFPRPKAIDALRAAILSCTLPGTRFCTPKNKPGTR